MAGKFLQFELTDFEETFSLVVNATNVRVVLPVAVSSNWEVRQLDVKKCLSPWFLTRGGVHELTSWFY